MKKIIAIAAVLLLVTAFAAPMSVLADDNADIESLLPTSATAENLTVSGCEYSFNIDGSITFELTAASATADMVFAQDFYKESGGGIIYSGNAVNIKEPAYFVYDYAIEGSATMTVIAHYTRVDKAAENTVADLYLSSMEGSDYTQYRSMNGDGYGIWDWGKYVTESGGGSRVFEDGMHRFTDVSASFSGAVGDKITFYTFGVSSKKNIEELGEIRPVVETSSEIESSEEEANSEDTSEETSELEESSVSESSEESSAEEISAEENSAEESSKATSSATSSAGTSSVTDNGNDGMPLWTIILIVVIAIAVIACVIFFIIKKKKN